MWCLFFLWMTITSQAITMDRVEATVGRQLVVSSDMTIENTLSSLDTSLCPLFQSGDLADLNRLIELTVIRELAGDVAIYRPSNDDVNGRLEGIKTAVSPRAWEQLAVQYGLDEVTLRTWVGRRLTIEKYLSRNLSTEFSRSRVWRAEYSEFIEREKRRSSIRTISPSGLSGL